MEKASTKRIAGQSTEEGNWLVLIESTGKEGVGYTHKCGAEIQGKDVIHPIWENPEDCSGSGRTEIQTVPFCPECEEEPSSVGSITIQ